MVGSAGMGGAPCATTAFSKRSAAKFTNTPPSNSHMGDGICFQSTLPLAVSHCARYIFRKAPDTRMKRQASVVGGLLGRTVH